MLNMLCMLNMLRMLTQTAEQVLMALNGRCPPHLVNPEVWAKRRL